MGRNRYKVIDNECPHFFTCTVVNWISVFTNRYPEMIQDEKMMLQKLEYMHFNPVKRGYVDDPIHWRYSSTGNYAEQEGLLAVCMEWRRRASHNIRYHAERGNE